MESIILTRDMEFTIRPWSGTDSVEEITEMLHLAYGELARQGMNYNASHQPPAQTLERLQAGDSFVAVESDSGVIVGTITLYHVKSTNHHQYYRRPGLVYFGQFGVRPDYQGFGIAKRLYQTVEDHARATGATEIALDTAETAHDLIAMYRRWGFEIVDTADWDSTNYISVIMSKPLI
ncbi:MAG: GNAT family N-acetyltransferase [Armatimonadota bacterium]